MNARELRIGNLVKGINNEIYSLTPDMIRMIFAGRAEFATGIPLTEEWLVKFGFQKGEKTIAEGQSYNIEIGSDRRLSINAISYNPHAWIKDYFSQSNVEDFVFVSHPKYVHHLQNLYFALTGQELEVKT